MYLLILTKDITNIIKWYLLPDKKIIILKHKKNLNTLIRCTEYIKLDLLYTDNGKYKHYNGPLDYFDINDQNWKRNIDKYWYLNNFI